MRTLRRAAAIGAFVVVSIVLIAFVIGPMKPEVGSPEADADALLRELRGGRVDAAVLRVANGGMNRETQLSREAVSPSLVVVRGSQRVFLNPAAGTNTYGRSGFSIHGGASPGSAGCIDLCDMVNTFFSEIPRNVDQVPVDVDYNNPLPKP